MFAFVVLCALVFASIVGGVCFNMRLGVRNSTGYLPEHQLVTLHQEAVTRRRDRKRRTDRLDTGMNTYIWRLTGLSFVVVTAIVVMIVVFLYVTL